MLLAFTLNILVVGTVVIVHYTSLERLSQLMPRLRLRYRFRIVVGLFGAILAHIVEVWLFAAVYYLMIRSGDFGTLLGPPEPDLLNCVYFSFSTYSTVGYGDIVPVGQLRFLAGLEGLTGLVLITWTASFMYYEMSHYWSNQ
jgi:hypothetical protein